MSELALAPTVPAPSPRPRAASRHAWVERLARFASSGLRPAAFCAREGVSLPSFYQWKRRLAAETAADTTESPGSPDPTPRLLPVRLPVPGGAVELVLPGGVTLRIPPGCDLAWVRCLVEALGGISC
jgi:hypothetical protein